ncbi:hypothetical protein BDP27DRAFT_1388222 [Rhodocollybia butyracea]|uniref:Uncharacterized protein n=1 Tax=Rhodocollybia butyracea TaxID=206335 RepID=A0A9P5QBH9_9AGAR|nr:hypothetical protein BDP27DRAFT_1388222 [Rhodocollybia butyracea]
MHEWLGRARLSVPKARGSHSDSASAYPSSFSSWTPSQYDSFQETFASLRDNTFDAWDESRLREWLLAQGIVAPKGPKEELVLVAKRRWRDWVEAKDKFSASASEAVYGYATDASSSASSTASAVSSYAAQATANVLPDHPFDAAKDYVWSSWDDTQLRKFIVDKGIIDNRTAAGKKRDELIQLATAHYANTKGTVYEAWGDSYIHDWLATHNVIDTRNSAQKSRDEYVTLMGNYYYDTKQHVWDTWSDSEMRTWLIDNGLMKSDAVATKEKMQKMIQDHYYSAQSTLTSAWSESQMRSWLIDNEYLRSDAQVKKDEVVSLFKEKYSSVATTLSSYTAPYLTWPDARLRAYLRESGVSDKTLPTSRPGLLQEVRIRWVQTSSSAQRMLNRLKEILDDNVVVPVEDQMAKIWDDKKDRAYEKVKEEL